MANYFSTSPIPWNLSPRVIDKKLVHQYCIAYLINISLYMVDVVESREEKDGSDSYTWITPCLMRGYKLPRGVVSQIYNQW